MQTNLRMFFELVNIRLYVLASEHLLLYFFIYIFTYGLYVCVPMQTVRHCGPMASFIFLAV